MYETAVSSVKRKERRINFGIQREKNKFENPVEAPHSIRSHSVYCCVIVRRKEIWKMHDSKLPWIVSLITERSTNGRDATPPHQDRSAAFLIHATLLIAFSKAICIIHALFFTWPVCAGFIRRDHLLVDAKLNIRDQERTPWATLSPGNHIENYNLIFRSINTKRHFRASPEHRFLTRQSRTPVSCAPHARISLFASLPFYLSWHGGIGASLWLHRRQCMDWQSKEIAGLLCKIMVRRT